MARSINEIQSGMLNSISQDETLSGMSSFSSTAVYKLLTYIVAVAVNLLESLFDTHEGEIAYQLANQKSGTLPWYRTMALNFLYGFDLVTDRDYFDITNATEEEIQNAKIVKYSAVNESEESSRVIIKIAGETAGVLSPITEEQKEAFEAYIKEIRVAGVPCTIINYLPDKLFLSIQIKRDALVLDANGMSILNGDEYPVKDAISQFMKELPFNGELKLSALVDKLQKVKGVIDATILGAQSSWINPNTSGYEMPQPIFISNIPVSGYYEVVTYDNIAYVV